VRVLSIKYLLNSMCDILIVNITNEVIDMSEAENTALNQDFGSSEDVNLEVVYDVPLQISAVLGKATMKISQLVRLSRGSVVELDKKVGDAVDVFVNDRIVAKGEIVLVDNKIGITITEIVKKG
jgi:flagellar motor switch protein FliN/FliY